MTQDWFWSSVLNQEQKLVVLVTGSSGYLGAVDARRLS